MPYLRLREVSGPSAPQPWQTGAVVTAPFGTNTVFGTAMVDGDGGGGGGGNRGGGDGDDDSTDNAEELLVHVYSTANRGTSIVHHSSPTVSMDSTWTANTALEPAPAAGYTLFNTAVARGLLNGTETYAMAVEVRQPKLGGGFQLVFATSATAQGPFVLQQNLTTTANSTTMTRSSSSSSSSSSTVTYAGSAGSAGSTASTASTAADKGLMFGPGSCPALRFDRATGYWHMLYTPNPTVAGGDYRTWQVYAARSKTLAFGSWEMSPLNPLFEADAFDRQVHNTKGIPPAQQGWAANTTNLNDSDPDLVEVEGKVLFVGNWGDQRTTPTNNLYQAVFDGTMAELWQTLYPAYR